MFLKNRLGSALTFITGILVMILVILKDLLPEAMGDSIRDFLKEIWGESYSKPLLFLYLFIVIILLYIERLRNSNDNEEKENSITQNRSKRDEIAQIRDELKAVYELRKQQKLGIHLPVNLRFQPFVSNHGNEELIDSFMTLNEGELQNELYKVFINAQGRLLIVGQPGAGKTTLLIQLALRILTEEPNTLPIIVNLSTWSSEFNKLSDWLVQILPKSIAKYHSHSSLVLLLDGLDEVPQFERDSCLRAIGEYGGSADGKDCRYIITSRSKEYESTIGVRNVNYPIEISPLAPKQVVEYLEKEEKNNSQGARNLLNSLKTDPVLFKALESPFYLNTARLVFSSGKLWSEFNFKAIDVFGRQSELVDHFVEDTLAGNKRNYSNKDAEKWLSFLAKKMDQDNLSTFELANIQPWWWGERWWEGLIFKGTLGAILGFMAGAIVCVSS